jgi:hypothetical protein
MYNNTTLKDLIEFLETMDPEKWVLDGFGSSHCDRGSYSELAFEPVAWAKIGDMLTFAKKAVGSTKVGYKGGEYVMGLNTPVYIGEWGCKGDAITPITFKYWRLIASRDYNNRDGMS